MVWTDLEVTGFGFFLALAIVDASERLLPNNARHKLTPNPVGARVVVLGRIVVLDLAVITTGALVVVIGALLDDANVVVLASVYFFAVEALLLTLDDGVDEYGNKSIVIGSEDGPDDGRSLIVLRILFELTVLIAFGDRVNSGLASASAKIYRK